MRVYLDLCCFNRPYDDQTQGRIRLETEAKLILQQKIRDAECELVWSAILDFENSKNPFEEHMMAIHQWRKLAVHTVMADESVVNLARSIMTFGMGEYDALHVACAIKGGVGLFVSTDDRLLKRLRQMAEITAMLPGEAIAFLENWYEN